MATTTDVKEQSQSEFVDEILVEIIAHARCLLPGTSVILKTLIDCDLYEETKELHIEIGTKLALLVREGKINLVRDGLTNKRHNAYRVI